MLNFHKDHKNLVLTAGLVFVALSVMVAILPAYQMQETVAIPDEKPLTEAEREGLHIYVRENCMACHTQQVRNIEMDKVWGSRPSIPSDYFYSKKRLDIWRQSPSVLGSERTGPDLTSIGARQPSEDWHLLHLYNPRAVVSASVMPSYPWLFYEMPESMLTKDDREVVVPEAYFNKPGIVLVASREALLLVDYLKSLKQTELPTGISKDFIPAKKRKQVSGTTADSQGAPAGPDGANLYKQVCMACHQDNGKGIPGAFPPLDGSKIVNDKNHETLIRIIIQGYDGTTAFGVMQPFGELLTDAEIAAIATHERSSWSNNAPPVSEDDVKKIREFINQELNP
ncbi:cbb3-type cytochrome c oxidase subunit II [Xanthomarina sp.]|uniref:cbb3-type cytochrome c oxidase subunit II n=1 Tax=Xanthomarina sp. TaxID=1931211 RepID=UPI002C618058|nr:cbb3-type cytochrome c oxidase subunit II [Xanthomarina sp.]HLV40590.1 cbb3-type cytochrome c oxidase subunit II [Xanthomarina sp.]